MLLHYFMQILFHALLSELCLYKLLNLNRKIMLLKGVVSAGWNKALENRPKFRL